MKTNLEFPLLCSCSCDRGYSCGSDLIPAWELLYATGVAKKKKKKRKQVFLLLGQVKIKKQILVPEHPFTVFNNDRETLNLHMKVLQQKKHYELKEEK